MSKHYIISAMLDVGKNSESIEKILNKGHNQGWIYFKFIPDIWNIGFEKPLTAKQAAVSIFEKNKYDLYCLTVQIKDTYATLHYLPDYPSLVLMIGELSDNWSRKFDGVDEIDIPRYTKVFVELIEDFQILELEVEQY